MNDTTTKDSGLMVLVKGMCVAMCCMMTICLFSIWISEAGKQRVRIEPASGE